METNSSSLAIWNLRAFNTSEMFDPPLPLFWSLLPGSTCHSTSTGAVLHLQSFSGGAARRPWFPAASVGVEDIVVTNLLRSSCLGDQGIHILAETSGAVWQLVYGMRGLEGTSWKEVKAQWLFARPRLSSTQQWIMGNQRHKVPETKDP